MDDTIARTSWPRRETSTSPHGGRPTLGLVLGAGGIQGCAHAGALQVLDEAGIRPDLVVDTSVDAMFCHSVVTT